MRVIYIAGPYRGADAWEIEQNVRKAEGAGLQVAKLGAAPLIPHSMTRFFQGTCTDEYWLRATLELLHRSDAILLLHGWQKSIGATAELGEAKRLGLPYFTQLEELQRWLTEVAP